MLRLPSLEFLIKSSWIKLFKSRLIYYSPIGTVGIFGQSCQNQDLFTNPISEQLKVSGQSWKNQSCENQDCSTIPLSEQLEILVKVVQIKIY